jgi:murein L,D-transpeptidase YcbB/YkuD
MTAPFFRLMSLAVASALVAPPLSRADDDDRPVDAVPFAARLAEREPARAEVLLRFYASREYRPVWTSGQRLSPQGTALVDVLRRADREGLDGRRYWDPVPGAEAADDQAIGQVELRLTEAFLRYASDVGEGRFDPAAENPYWAQRPRALDAEALLCDAVASEDVAKTLEGLLPRHPQYAALREALHRYRAIAEAGGWPAVPPARRRPLRPGQRAPEVATLRERLLAEGDLRGTAPPSRANLFDDAVAAALKRFQSRHGLSPGGVLDKETVLALNVPVEGRVRQIELNLERWRWLSPSLADRFVLVNIPGFELHAFEGGRDVLRMRVVTGDAARAPTPVFARPMTEVVFRPFWNVPTSIAEDEILPAQHRDRGYLRRHNMELVRGEGGTQLRQRPGPGNALGLVKFLLPNPFGVYLHDTPERALFARARRDESHGCVRVERPVDLARFALQGAPQWTPARIRAAMAKGREQHVALKEPLPVVVTYLTAWADEGGVTRFFPDVYEHDTAQLRLLR